MFSSEKVVNNFFSLCAETKSFSIFFALIFSEKEVLEIEFNF